MATTTLTKTAGSTAISWANGDLASAAQYISGAFSVATAYAVAFDIQVARRTGTAFTSDWPKVRIESSAKASGNDAWSPAYTFVMPVGASIANTTLNGAVSAGATTCVVTSATNIAIGDVLFLGHTTTPANYELVRVKLVSGTTVTFEEACAYAHDTGAQVTDQAEKPAPVVIDCAAYTRLRVICDNANSGQAAACQVLYTTLDSIGTA